MDSAIDYTIEAERLEEFLPEEPKNKIKSRIKVRYEIPKNKKRKRRKP